MMMPVRRGLPSGTVTFLFTDVEGSTKLLHELGADEYAAALAGHRRIVRAAAGAHGGVEVDTQGDAFFFAFPTAAGALLAAEAMTEALASGPTRVRVGLHTGTPLLTNEGYVGGDVHRAARIAAAGHGGQVLVSSSTAHLVETQLTDLGEHRLKDLSAPERIYQLGESGFPALKSLYRTNLPIPATPFLGRERELADVIELLSRDEIRLLTLTGPGGTGKTRLAAHAAGLASDGYADGVWWVPLAPLRDPTLVIETAAAVVGAENGLGQHISDKSMLLLFDNFEQVVEAATDLASLLGDCPNLDLLVTSREPLHIAGEQEYMVPPLVPEEGVAFFLARAKAVRPGFQLDASVSEICRRLDDLPLALELAAARVKALSTSQILERLEQRLPLLIGGPRDLPERQRTLRATIEWSYDLLSSQEQRLFSRLAVFRGGCTLGAAEEVAEADLDVLQSLVDKSLARHSNERYWLLETIRDYADEQLEAAGEGEELRQRHAGYFMQLAEDAEPYIRGTAREGEGLDRLEPELDNLRAAFDRLQAAGESQLTLQLAGALWKFWNFRAHMTEGERRLGDALRADERPTAARARALVGAAGLALGIDRARARLRAEEALELNRALDDPAGTALSTYLLGYVCAEEGDFARALPLFEESLLAFRELRDDHYTLLASWAVAWMCEQLGDLERARAIDEESLPVARALGNVRMEAMFVDRLAESAIDEGRIQDALSMLTDTLRLYRELRAPVSTAESISHLARALAAAGNFDHAARLVACSETLLEEVEVAVPSEMARRHQKLLPTIREKLDEATFAEAWEQGRRITVDEAVALALASLE